MSVTAGKEDNYQRKLFERENEIRMFKSEIHSLREQIEQQTQLAQLKT